jgi:hypothetical protein
MKQQEKATSYRQRYQRDTASAAISNIASVSGYRGSVLALACQSLSLIRMARAPRASFSGG